MTAKKKTSNKSTRMTDSVKRKLSLLELAAELGNVSKACDLMGYHRDTFYEVRRAFQVGGVSGLLEKKRGAKGPHPNRVPQEVEKKILDFSLERPTYGAQRVANELRLTSVNVRPSGVRNVWLRHETLTSSQHGFGSGAEIQPGGGDRLKTSGHECETRGLCPRIHSYSKLLDTGHRKTRPGTMQWLSPQNPPDRAQRTLRAAGRRTVMCLSDRSNAE